VAAFFGVAELAAAVLAALVFRAVFSTRFVHYYALTGMVILAAGFWFAPSSRPVAHAVGDAATEAVPVTRTRME
jgi:hypothetical protein